MPYFGQISWRDLVKALQDAGFEGPYPGKRHPYMIRGTLKMIIPNPHKGIIDVSFLHRLLRQAEISREEWEKL